MRLLSIPFMALCLNFYTICPLTPKVLVVPLSMASWAPLTLITAGHRIFCWLGPELQVLDLKLCNYSWPQEVRLCRQAVNADVTCLIFFSTFSCYTRHGIQNNLAHVLNWRPQLPHLKCKDPITLHYSEKGRKLWLTLLPQTKQPKINDLSHSGSKMAVSFN